MTGLWKRFKSHYLDNRLFYNVLFGWTVLFLGLRTIQHLSFQTNTYDLSIFDYMMHFTLHGEFMAEPFHGYWGSHFAIHFTPILLPILPFYFIFKGPLFLLYLQIFVGAVSAAVFYSILKKEWQKSPLSILIAFSYLIYRPFLNGIMYDFHPEMFFPLIFFLAYYFLTLKKNNIFFFLFISLALLIKEDVAVYLFFFGIFLFFRMKENRRIGLVTSVISLCYFLITMGIIIPYFRERLGMGTAFEFSSLWQGTSDNVFDIIKSLATHPLSILKTISWTTVFQGFFNIISPLLFIPFLSWFVILIFPMLFILATSKSPIMQGFGLHYISSMLPFLFLALSDGLKNLGRLIHEQKKSRKFLVYLAAAILLINLVNTRWNLLNPSRYSALKDYKTVKEYIRLIPPESSVAATSSLIPHIPKRRNIYMLPNSDDAEYILIHSGINPWPLEKQQLENLIGQFSESKKYLCLKSKGPLKLFKKVD